MLIEVFNERYNKEVRYVATHLRHDDFDEVYAVNGESPHISILEDWEGSARRWIIFNKKCEPVAILGVRPLIAFSDIACPWLLGTDGLNEMKKFFVKISKPIIAEMMKGYKLLVNYVDARNVKSVRWLKWCGFDVEDPEPFGALNIPFHKYTMESV